MADKLVKIATFSSSEDVHIAKMLLGESDIESVILGENLLMAFPRVGLPEVELHVWQSQAEEAIGILESQKKQQE